MPCSGVGMEKTSRVAATAKTPSLKASALDLLNLALLPEALGLRTVAARRHGAPATRVVARAIEVSPPARWRAAELEPAPVLVIHRRKRGGDNAAEGAGHAGGLWLEPRPAVRTETRSQLAGRGGLVERGQVDGVDVAAAVGADDSAQ